MIARLRRSVAPGADGTNGRDDPALRPITGPVGRCDAERTGRAALGTGPPVARPKAGKRLPFAAADPNGRPLSFFMTAGQVSDYADAAALLDDLTKAQCLLGDRRYATETLPYANAGNAAGRPARTSV